MAPSLATILLVALLAGAGLAATDLYRIERSTLVVYATPALRDFLERDAIPRYANETGVRVEPVYVAAGEQYNRLKLSGRSPEADLFLHASPLYLEKGHEEGYFEAIRIPAADGLNATFRSREVDGGHIWYAFAWTPLLEVYSANLPAPPDLATSDAKFGLAHPRLSNNGIYNVLLFETADPEAGKHVLARTLVQPVDARSSINGVADGSFDATLGYEAVTLLYQAKGARVASALPELHGEKQLLQVLFSVALVRDHHHADPEPFLHFLFTNETQERLGGSHLRPVAPGMPDPANAVDVSGVAPLPFDWSRWRELEEKLQDYEVKT